MHSCWVVEIGWNLVEMWKQTLQAEAVQRERCREVFLQERWGMCSPPKAFRHVACSSTSLQPVQHTNQPLSVKEVSSMKKVFETLSPTFHNITKHTQKWHTRAHTFIRITYLLRDIVKHLLLKRQTREWWETQSSFANCKAWWNTQHGDNAKWILHQRIPFVVNSSANIGQVVRILQGCNLSSVLYCQAAWYSGEFLVFSLFFIILNDSLRLKCCQHCVGCARACYEFRFFWIVWWMLNQSICQWDNAPILFSEGLQQGASKNHPSAVLSVIVLHLILSVKMGCATLSQFFCPFVFHVLTFDWHW